MLKGDDWPSLSRLGAARSPPCAGRVGRSLAALSPHYHTLAGRSLPDRPVPRRPPGGAPQGTRNAALQKRPRPLPRSSPAARSAGKGIQTPFPASQSLNPVPRLRRAGDDRPSGLLQLLVDHFQEADVLPDLPAREFGHVDLFAVPAALLEEVLLDCQQVLVA